MLSKFNLLLISIKSNKWHWFFYLFCRIALAIGFFAAGFVKIYGERFANGLSKIHPMGAYLEALYHTGFYYTSIGYAQVIAALLLLIPRTVTLGALIYFPIIINIWILTLAVRFDGSFITAPLMLLANLYILVWNYDKLQHILPIKPIQPIKIKAKSCIFPYRFFLGVFSCCVLIVLLYKFGYTVMPKNSKQDCFSQFKTTDTKLAGFTFCECIHSKGKSLDYCLEQFNSKRK